MLYVTVQAPGTGGRMEVVGALAIRNDGTHGGGRRAPRGSYVVELTREGRVDRARVEDFDRGRGALALVYEALSRLGLGA